MLLAHNPQACAVWPDGTSFQQGLGGKQTRIVVRQPRAGMRQLAMKITLFMQIKANLPISGQQLQGLMHTLHGKPGFLRQCRAVNGRFPCQQRADGQGIAALRLALRLAQGVQQGTFAGKAAIWFGREHDQ